jgi:hypothetical protein
MAMAGLEFEEIDQRREFYQNLNIMDRIGYILGLIEFVRPDGHQRPPQQPPQQPPQRPDLHQSPQERGPLSLDYDLANYYSVINHQNEYGIATPPINNRRFGITDARYMMTSKKNIYTQENLTPEQQEIIKKFVHYFDAITKKRGGTTRILRSSKRRTPSPSSPGRKRQRKGGKTKRRK